MASIDAKAHISTRDVLSSTNPPPPQPQKKEVNVVKNKNNFLEAANPLLGLVTAESCIISQKIIQDVLIR